ncbi:hypothetical protein AOLI_G00114080 [Acnodon oligacanthus]
MEPLPVLKKNLKNLNRVLIMQLILKPCSSQTPNAPQTALTHRWSLHIKAQALTAHQRRPRLKWPHRDLNGIHFPRSSALEGKGPATVTRATPTPAACRSATTGPDRPRVIWCRVNTAGLQTVTATVEAPARDGTLPLSRLAARGWRDSLPFHVELRRNAWSFFCPPRH